MDLSVVIPCYNEAGNLPTLFDRAARAVPAELALEMIFVNNGSTDGSAAVFAQLLPRHAFARGVDIEVNQGYGHGILTGLRAARGHIVGWTHADLQTDPADVVESYRAHRDRLLAGRTLVKGRRMHRPFFDKVFTKGMEVFASIALGSRFSDVNAQPKLFPRALLADMERAPRDFSLDLYLLWLARQQNFDIVEYPVEFGRRIHGEAKGGASVRLKWRLTRRTVGFIAQLRRDVRAGRV
jgi:glycosyltransferase involved in cell wall biosynthesis